MKKLFAGMCIFSISFLTVYGGTDEHNTKTLSDLGIINKKTQLKDYNLNQNVLRQEIAAVTLGLSGFDKKERCNSSFKDVTGSKPNTWACYSIEALLDKGLIARNDYFYPESNISKAESVGMIVKAVYKAGYNYNSANPDSWEKQVIDFAVEQGIVDDFADYSTPATRGFVFDVAVNAIDKEGVTVSPNFNKQVTYKSEEDESLESLEDVVKETYIDEDIEKILCELLDLCK